MRIETHSTTCNRCGCYITWANFTGSKDDGVGFSSVLSKLRYHQDNDVTCLRNGKIKELLGEEKAPDPIQHFVIKEIKIS